jgi:hypothetical protein
MALPVYEVKRLVRATKINAINGSVLICEHGDIAVNPEWIEKHKPQIGGYYVSFGGDWPASFGPERLFESMSRMVENGN